MRLVLFSLKCLSIVFVCVSSDRIGAQMQRALNRFRAVLVEIVKTDYFGGSRVNPFPIIINIINAK